MVKPMDTGSLLVMAVMLILFVVALYTKGFSHDLLLEAGMTRVRAKSMRQSEYLIGLWEALLAPLGFTLNSPRDAHRRGSHISLGHVEGLRIDLALINGADGTVKSTDGRA